MKHLKVFVLGLLLSALCGISAADFCTVTFDHLEQDTWNANNTSSVNPINFDYPPLVSFVSTGSQSNSLLFSGTYSKNLAGALISKDLALPPAFPGRTFAYVAINIKQFVPAYPDQTILRDENDLKWTLVSGATTPLPNQANISTQINTQTMSWQLDPTGKAWVDSGYVPTTLKFGQNNVLQIRAWSNGTVWSVTSLQCNAEAPFTPGTLFQNIPLITTNWSAGLHAQLQWEGGNAPFSATVYYPRVQVAISDGPIPFIDPNNF